MPEAGVVVCTPDTLDVYPRGSGCLSHGIKVKLVDASGNKVTQHETLGELCIQGPSIAPGYLNNTQTTSETFVHQEDGRWIRSGDEALVAVSAKGSEQLVIVDRIKELIKVKVCNESALLRGCHSRCVRQPSCARGTRGPRSLPPARGRLRRHPGSRRTRRRGPQGLRH